MDWTAAVGRRPRLGALLGALCISFSGIFFLYSHTSPATAAVFRCLYALPFLGLFALAELRRHGALDRRHSGIAIVAGAFFAADLLFWNHAVDDVGAGLATVVGNLQVVIVSIIAWVVLHERLSRRMAAAVPVMLAGVALISGLVGTGAYGSDPRLGVVFGVVSALAYSGYLLLSREANPGGNRPATMLFLSSLTTAVTAAIVGSLLGAFDPIPSWPAHGWLLALALTSQVSGYLLISASQPRLPAAITSAILLAQPVATVFLAGVLLGEAPSLVQYAGVGLVIAGLLVTSLRSGMRVSPREAVGGEPEVVGTA